MLHRWLLCVCLILTLLACGTPKRAEFGEEELARRDRDISEHQLAQRRDAFKLLLDRLERDLDEGRAPQINVLFLSGGGAWGAFGAGFLKAWQSEIPSDHELAWPDLDVVSGVSTGGLMAPFAAIGSPDRLKQADDMYRNCSPDWVTISKWSLIRGDSGIADTEGLDTVLQEQFDLDLARELVALQEEEKRQVFVTSTDLDLGRPVTWRLGDESRRALDSQDPHFLFRAARASAAIPGVFSPVFVDGAMHVDGALFGQIHLVADPRMIERLLLKWEERRPGAPKPAFRFWVVVNNLTRMPRETVQPTWTSIMARANSVLFKEQVTGPLNQLALFCTVLRSELQLDAHMRWVAIPRDFEMPETETEFDPVLTRPLSDLGAMMGADPASWLGEEDLGLVELERAVLDEEDQP